MREREKRRRKKRRKKEDIKAKKKTIMKKTRKFDWKIVAKVELKSAFNRDFPVLLTAKLDL